jgi:hypothetical protein
MNFELFAAAFEYAERLVRNSKFKIENSKLKGLKAAIRRSEPPTSIDAMPSTETE